MSSTLGWSVEERPLFTTRKIVHLSMLGFAFLLPFLTWQEAAGCALLALGFNLFILPRLGADLRKSPPAAGRGGLARTSHPAPANSADVGGQGTAIHLQVVQPAESVWTGIVIYPISVLALILLYPHTLYVAAAVWAIMALGDGMASVAGGVLGGPGLPHNPAKTWAGVCGFFVAGTAGAYLLTRWVAPLLPTEKVLIVSAATALVGAVVETFPILLDDNVTVPLVSGAFMYCAYLVERSALASNLPYLGRRALLALSVNLAFALLALALKVVTRSGATVGLILGAAVYLGYGYKSFLILLAFFVLGSLATRLGYAKKAARGIAERRGGARSWREALANILAGAFFSVLGITTRQERAFLVALVAAFAEAAGDTVASEIGQWLGPRAYLITTLEHVPVGEHGGVSWIGTAAGFVASSGVVALGYGLALCGTGGAALALGAAFLGTVMDSVLGATLERRGLLTNGLVNFAGTSFAGGFALGLAMHLHL